MAVPLAGGTASRLGPTGSVVVLDGQGAPPALVGGKAAALDRLIGWAIPVPPSAVVTVPVYREVANEPAVVELLARLQAGEVIAAEDVDACFLEVGLPDKARADIAAAARAISGGRPLAVRSSATVEDLERSSFAGQYRSLLHVRSDEPEALERAVLSVFASLFHPAACAYRTANGLEAAGGDMAVLMMPMVDARRAGVVFTADPTGSTGMVRVEFVDGLGEALVSGEETPRVLLLDPATDGCAEGPEFTELLSLARDIARRSVSAQDIEWAWDGSQVWIVQARPVTASSGEGDEFDDDRQVLEGADLTTSGISEMLPGVLPPLIWQLSSHLVEEAFRSLLDDLAVMPADMPATRTLIRRVHGRAALDIGRLSATLAGIPGAASRLDHEYFGEALSDDAVEELGVRHHASAFVHRWRTSRARRRASFSADVVIQAAAEIAGGRHDITQWSSPRLWTYHGALLDLAGRAMAAELVVASDAAAIHAGLRAVLTKYLPPAAANRHSNALAVPADVDAALADASAAVFAGPTWLEVGRPTVSATPRVTTRRDQAFDELLADLASTPRWPDAGWRRVLRQRQLEHLATQAATQLQRRERAKSALLTIGGEVRRIHLELGRRLVDGGHLGRPVDVELLTLHELHGALEGSSVPPSTIERRQRWRARHEMQGPLPLRFSGVPPPAFVKPAGSVRQLTGWGASGGTFIGTAKRVDCPNGSIDRSEVLVATATDPSWSPLLMRCGAMVIERGGPLSHAAIVAREFGVPAVFNVADAVGTLDGRRVLVDGDAGVVTVLEEDPRP